jgi:hypothetical protein
MKHVRWLPVGIRELEELCEKYEDPHFRRTSRAPNEFAN